MPPNQQSGQIKIAFHLVKSVHLKCSGSRNRNREDFVIATKCRYPREGFVKEKPWRPSERGYSRKHIVAEVEESLRNLKTDYIDLYQVIILTVLIVLWSTMKMTHILEMDL